MKRQVLFLVLIFGAANGVSQAGAACKPPGPTMTQSREAEFVREPLGVLASSATSERSAAMLSGAVSQLAATSPDALDALQVAIAKGTMQQNHAIGRGLYQTVDYCLAIDSAVSMRVQKMIVSLVNKDVIDGYTTSQNMAVANSTVTSTGFSEAGGKAAVVGLVGRPAPDTNDSLTLSDPFGSPDDWK